MMQQREQFAAGKTPTPAAIHAAADEAYPEPEQAVLRMAFAHGARRRLEGRPVMAVSIATPKARAVIKGDAWALRKLAAERAADDLSDHLYSTMCAAMRVGRA